jgi:hypothetical protein
MLAKHTPGPWYNTDSKFAYVTATDTDGNPITICTTLSNANARLIAAAPDLAHALRMMLREHDALQMAAGSHEDRWTAATLARSILDKIE